MDEKEQPLGPSAQDEQLESFFYQFRHSYYRAEQVYRRLYKKNGNFSFELKLNKEKGGKVSYNVPDEQTAKEFAVSMSVFLLPGSFLNIDDLLRTLQQLSTDKEGSSLFCMGALRISYRLGMNCRKRSYILCYNVTVNENG